MQVDSTRLFMKTFLTGAGPQFQNFNVASHPLVELNSTALTALKLFLGPSITFNLILLYENNWVLTDCHMRLGKIFYCVACSCVPFPDTVDSGANVYHFCVVCEDTNYVYQQIFAGGSAVAFQRKDSAESFGSIVIYPSLTNIRVHVLHASV